MNEFHILYGVFAVLGGALGYMVVLLLRELRDIWSETLNGAAREIR